MIRGRKWSRQKGFFPANQCPQASGSRGLPEPLLGSAFQSPILEASEESVAFGLALCAEAGDHETTIKAAVTFVAIKQLQALGWFMFSPGFFRDSRRDFLFGATFAQDR